MHHRIPNFVDAEKAAARLADLPEFKASAVVKVNPDTPQKMVSQCTTSMHYWKAHRHAMRCVTMVMLHMASFIQEQ